MTVQLFIAGVHVCLALLVSAHIVLTKQDVRSAIGWAGLVWLAPVLGSVLYAFLGINLIRRRAGLMRRGRVLSWTEGPAPALLPAEESPLPAALPAALRPLATLVGAMTGAPLTTGNEVQLLVNGDEAYPVMLAAIEGARSTIALTTYIFDAGVVGARFVDALARAVTRGVEVRILVDGVGARYSHPPIIHALRAAGVTVALFLPPTVPWKHPYVNVRSHRKLLIIDGTVGFCGGLNIRDDCLLSLQRPDATQDVHCSFRGPVVESLSRAFAFDWAFAAREELTGPGWFPQVDPGGAVIARGIADGPDEHLETLHTSFLGALAQARESVRIVTPYFLPDPALIDALRVAALRGVQVDIVLPQQGNLRVVQWAATAQLLQVIDWGCRVFLTPPPFDHSKLFVVDDAWTLTGSPNWDPRSLRLNFEFAVECYSEEFAARAAAVIAGKMAGAHRVRAEELNRRPLAVKLRDGVARLGQPYL